MTNNDPGDGIRPVMEQFDPDRRCPKCGSAIAATFQHHQSNVPGQSCGTDIEHMHRTCPDCKANWAEAPLDVD